MHFRKALTSLIKVSSWRRIQSTSLLLTAMLYQYVDIENEIIIICKLKFPELESLVHHPIDYARVVKKIGNEMDLTLVDLEGLLPSAIIMVVSVTASTTSGKPLSEDNLEKTIEACDRALTLDAAKKKVLDFVESRMGYIAPNLSAVVSSAVASKLDFCFGVLIVHGMWF